MKQVLIDDVLVKEFTENGYSLLPFPQSLRLEMLGHIESHIRTLGGSFAGKNKNLSLEKVAMSVPDEVWSEKMNRAFRMFPRPLCDRILKWADQNVREKFGREASAVNSVFPEELKINTGLDPQRLAIYWRCVRPGKPDAGRPHRDATFWVLAFEDGYDPLIPFPFDYIKDSIKIWIPLQGCTPDTTLQVIPRSHLVAGDEVVEMTEYGRRPTLSDEWLDQHKNDFMSPIELSKGSCIVFDMNLVHRGPVHNNNELRISAELTLVVK